jgi:transcriptional regulator with XRE-family HTH domain
MRPSRNALLLQALGTTLKERRGELKLTQEDVAGVAEIDRPFITLIESATKQPTISVLWRLAAAVELTPAEFISRVDQRYQDIRAIGASPGKASRAKIS